MLKNLKGKKKGFTLIELMVVIVIIGILVAIALPNFIAAQDRAKASSVKGNMHTAQTMLETYAVDWGGQYPINVSTLKSEGTTKSYWKDFKNPFSGLSGLATGSTSTTAGSIDDLNAVTTTSNPDTNKPTLNAALSTNTAAAATEGLVAYDPRLTGTNFTKYYIYGVTKKNIPIDDKGVVLTLSNN